jgi:hypothetical protein
MHRCYRSCSTNASASGDAAIGLLGKLGKLLDATTDIIGRKL